MAEGMIGEARRGVLTQSLLLGDRLTKDSEVDPEKDPAEL